MEMFVIGVLLACTVSVAEAAAAADCDTCTSTFADSTDCAVIKTYISCLIDTYETDKTLTGCSNIKSKMDTAYSAYDTNSCSVTDACLCEVVYYQTATLDCEAINAKLVCIFGASDLGCDGSKTKMALVAEAKTVGALSGCLTDNCLCLANFYENDITSSESTKCTALKNLILCEETATENFCDGTATPAQVAALADSLIADGSTVNCRTDLTDSCLCQIERAKTDTSAAGALCTASKVKLECLFPATAVGCDGSTTKIALVAAEKTTGKAIANCITDTCECQATYHETDVTAAAAKCTALKNEMNCLDAATGLACDGTKRSDEIATTMDALIVDGGGVNCLTDLTDTCICQITYAKIDVSVAATKCTKLKEKLHCLIAANDVGCDGTSTRSAVATATDANILNTVDNCRTDLTSTCTCGINYAKTDTTDQVTKCLAAITAQTCLTGITTSATEFACDGTTLVETYLNSTITPLATLACDGTSLLLSTSVAMACLLVVFEMFHK